MTWQRRARLVVAAIGLSCAAALYFLAKPREKPVAAPAQTAPDRQASQQSGAGTIVHSKDGKKVFELKFGKNSDYPDGRSVFEAVQVAFVEGHQMSADFVETKGTSSDGEGPRNFDFKGNVKLVDKGGATVTTGSATYDSSTGVVTMPGEVTFTRDRMSGHGVGATYLRDQDFLQLLDQASLKVTPEPGKTDSIDATAKTMSFARPQKSLRLEQGAKIVRPSETLEADNATFGLTDDEKAIRYLELRGNSRVTPANVPDAPPRMSAHDITLGFEADTRTLEHATLTGDASVGLASDQGTRSIAAAWIDMFLTSDGKTLRALQARDHVVVELPATKDAPARVIKSTTLDGQGDDKGLRSAQFDRDVTFEESTGAKTPPRTGKSRTLVLQLGGQLDAIEQAEFRQNVVFVDGSVRGDGDLGTYDARGKGKLTLTRGEGRTARDPRVTDGSFVVDAQTIDVALDTHDLTAKGNVRTIANPQKKPEDTKSPGLFDQGEPVRGSANELAYTDATGKAIYTGSSAEQAQLKQPKAGNVTTADVITVVDSTRSLQAKGHVSQEFRSEAKGTARDAPSKTSKQTVTSDSMVYDDTARTAVYVSGVTMKSDDGVTEGEKLTLYLAKEEQSIERLEVEGKGDNVYAQISGGYEVRGDHLDYDAATDIYHVVGKPVRVKSPNQDRSGCVISRGPEVKLNRKLNTVEWPPGRADAVGADELVKCDVSIRKTTAGR
jgi:lipopolysaccharide export system protein LptA